MEEYEQGEVYILSLFWSHTILHQRDTKAHQTAFPASRRRRL
jgi:hypothetical protein